MCTYFFLWSTKKYLNTEEFYCYIVMILYINLLIFDINKIRISVFAWYILKTLFCIATNLTQLLPSIYFIESI